MMQTAAARIRSAFPATALTFERSDSWSSYPDADVFECEAANRTWAQLDARLLERHHDAVSYASPALFAALLPAWLTALLTDADELDMLPYFILPALTPGGSDEDDARLRARAAKLDAAQTDAVGQALEALAEREDYADHHDDIGQASKRFCSARRR